MYLKEIRVKNFRSLKNVIVKFDEATILIGENNAGKSTVLDALRIALSRTAGRTSFEEFDFYMDEETTSPKDSEGISIVLTFEERTAGEWEGYISDTFVDAIQYPEGDKAVVYLRVSAKYNEVFAEIEAKTEFLNNNFEPISGKIQNQVNKFLAICPVFYLQALREIKDVFGAKSPLWGKFMKKATIPKDKIKEIQDQIENLNKEIISNDENLSSLVDELQKIQRVMDFSRDELVSINAVPLKSWDLLSKAQVVLNNGTSTMDFPLEKHGQGTQSVSAILLFKAYISILLKELNSDAAEAILTLEEPEAHLHPQAIRALQKSIAEIACQKIITTHSPYFIQNVDIRNVRYIKKEQGATLVSQIVDQYSFKVVEIKVGLRHAAEAFSEILEIDDVNNMVTIKKPIENAVEGTIRGCCTPIEGTIEDVINEARNIFSVEELHSINMCIQKNRGDILFARKWFLYEGQTEEVLLPYFARLMERDFDEHGISGIMYRNNGSAKAFVKLAKVLGIPWLVLGDNDQQGEKTKKEVKSCGYDEATINDKVILTDAKDIEHELICIPDIMADYESFMIAELGVDEIQLKNDGKIEEYKTILVEKIQKGKVENAYKLIDQWEARGFSQNDIPEFFKKLIEKV